MSTLAPARQWGERFPVQETAFAAGTPPGREGPGGQGPLMKGGGGPEWRRWDAAVLEEW